MTTPKQIINVICDESDKGTTGMALYQPSLTKATRNKGGLTTFTFVVRVKDFIPEDALHGRLVAFLAIGTKDALKSQGLE